MNIANESKGFEKVCDVPAGTVTHDHASTSTLVVPEVNRSFPLVTMKVCRDHGADAGVVRRGRVAPWLR
jgi:hypothetical protein